VATLLHPSTLEVLHELDLLDDVLKLPHESAYGLAAYIGDTPIPVVDFSHLPTRCKFIAFIPQWDFLNFLAEQAARYPNFDLRMRCEAISCRGIGRVAGVRTQMQNGPFEIRADLVVAADARTSVLREKAGLTVRDLGAPMDVLWFGLSRHPGDPEQTMGRHGGVSHRPDNHCAFSGGSRQ
jgi:2-polyprenyl-6-methoxyphenol hydroxylase-like FAD-dependent oxidoreductase